MTEMSTRNFSFCQCFDQAAKTQTVIVGLGTARGGYWQTNGSASHYWGRTAARTRIEPFSAKDELHCTLVPTAILQYPCLMFWALIRMRVLHVA
jgi:hypothetical protein